MLWGSNITVYFTDNEIRTIRGRAVVGKGVIFVKRWFRTVEIIPLDKVKNATIGKPRKITQEDFGGGPI